ncbi:unnamed protein product, partial [Oncorhynchus mykiss]
NSTNEPFTATGSTASMGPHHRQNDWVKMAETREEDLQFDIAVVEGDIMISEDRLAVKSLWPEKDGVASIPYKINDDLVCQIRETREDHVCELDHFPVLLSIQNVMSTLECQVKVDRKVTILAAFKMISDQTCILFHEYTNEINYIKFISGTGSVTKMETNDWFRI